MIMGCENGQSHNKIGTGMEDWSCAQDYGERHTKSHKKMKESTRRSAYEVMETIVEQEDLDSTGCGMRGL